MHVHRRTMAGLGRYVCQLLVVLEYLSVVLVIAQNPMEDKTTFEAAFQGEFVFINRTRGFMNSRQLGTEPGRYGNVCVCVCVYPIVYRFDFRYGRRLLEKK